MRGRAVLLALFCLIALCTFIGCTAPPDDPQRDQRQADQAQPVDPKAVPTLETATLYVAGSNGGPYKVSWTVWTPKGSVQHEFRGTGIIKDEPTAYPIDLEGFRTDSNKGFFLGYDDIDMEATKTERWKGELVLLLKVNDTLVECDTMRENSARQYPGDASFGFDPDSRKDYKEEGGCANRLDS